MTGRRQTGVAWHLHWGMSLICRGVTGSGRHVSLILNVTDMACADILSLLQAWRGMAHLLSLFIQWEAGRQACLVHEQHNNMCQTASLSLSLIINVSKTLSQRSFSSLLYHDATIWRAELQTRRKRQDG